MVISDCGVENDEMHDFRFSNYGAYILGFHSDRGEVGEVAEMEKELGKLADDLQQYTSS